MRKVLNLCDHCGKEQVEPLHICGLDRKVEHTHFSVWHKYACETELCDECYSKLLKFVNNEV
ncbi:MAG: hypothetical protein RR091_10290 [Cloacibacillus sp.]